MQIHQLRCRRGRGPDLVRVPQRHSVQHAAALVRMPLACGIGQDLPHRPSCNPLEVQPVHAYHGRAAKHFEVCLIDHVGRRHRGCPLAAPQVRRQALQLLVHRRKHLVELLVLPGLWFVHASTPFPLCAGRSVARVG